MSSLRIAQARRRAGGQTLRAFYTRGFWRIWTGSMVWYSARWMDLFVLQWQVLVMTDSAFHVSLVGFYRMAPMFVFGLLTGVLADRLDRRALLLAAQLWNAVASAAIGALILTGHLALWHLAVLVTALGFSWALDLPSRRSYIYEMVGPRRVVNAMALDHVGMDGAKIVGPILGGLLWPVIGAGGCLLILSAGYLVNYWLYRRLPSAPPQPTGSPRVLRNLMDGLAYVFRTPVILGVVAVTAVMNLLGFPYQHMVPVVGRHVLELGPLLTGLLLAADGLGALTGSLVVASLGEVSQKGRLFVAGSVLMMTAVLLFSLSRWYLLAFGLLFMVGAGTACFATMQSSLVLTSASDAMRGRAMGALMLAIGFGPLGALLIGSLASVWGAPRAVTVFAGTGILLLACVFWKATVLWQARAGV
jgi:MFS family permease